MKLGPGFSRPARIGLGLHDRVRTLVRAARSSLRRVWIRLAPRSFLRACSPSHVELGIAGEELAARAVRKAGFVVLARRLCTRHGEIDLLAREGDTLVAIEVKSGRVDRVPRPRGVDDAPSLLLRWRPGARAGRPQLARIERAVRALARAGRERWRVDVVEVLVEPGGRLVHVHYVRVGSTSSSRPTRANRPAGLDHRGSLEHDQNMAEEPGERA